MRGRCARLRMRASEMWAGRDRASWRRARPRRGPAGEKCRPGKLESARGDVPGWLRARPLYMPGFWREFRSERESQHTFSKQDGMGLGGRVLDTQRSTIVALNWPPVVGTDEHRAWRGLCICRRAAQISAHPMRPQHAGQGLACLCLHNAHDQRLTTLSEPYRKNLS